MIKINEDDYFSFTLLFSVILSSYNIKVSRDVANDDGEKYLHQGWHQVVQVVIVFSSMWQGVVLHGTVHIHGLIFNKTG